MLANHDHTSICDFQPFLIMHAALDNHLYKFTEKSESSEQVKSLQYAQFMHSGRKNKHKWRKMHKNISAIVVQQ